jgi:hypothetical protein
MPEKPGIPEENIVRLPIVRYNTICQTTLIKINRAKAFS